MFRSPKHFVAAKGPFTGASLDRMEEAYDNLGRAADVCRFSIRYLESHENSGKVSKDDHLPSLNSLGTLFGICSSSIIPCWIKRSG